MYNTIDEIKMEIEKRGSYIDSRFACVYTIFKIFKGIYDALLYIGIICVIFAILNGYIVWMWIFVCILMIYLDYIFYKAIKFTITKNKEYCKLDMILNIFILYSNYNNLEEWERSQIIEKDLAPVVNLQIKSVS